MEGACYEDEGGEDTKEISAVETTRKETHW